MDKMNSRFEWCYRGDEFGRCATLVPGGKGTRKPNLRGRKAGRMHTRKETKNLGLRKITDELGPQPFQFEWKDNGTMLPLSDHSSHWANLLREIVREFSIHFGFWRNISLERKARVLEKIGGIDQHLGKIYTDNKSSLKMDYWVKNPDDKTYDMEAIRSRYADLHDSRVPIPNPDLLRYTYCWRRILAEEMLRLQGLGTYTDNQIMAMIQSQHESGSGSGSGVGGDDESDDDEDADEDEEDTDS
nr:hypothetical protein [Tanacetum cinerariifolium]